MQTVCNFLVFGFLYHGPTKINRIMATKANIPGTSHLQLPCALLLLLLLAVVLTGPGGGGNDSTSDPGWVGCYLLLASLFPLPQAQTHRHSIQVWQTKPMDCQKLQTWNWTKMHGLSQTLSLFCEDFLHVYTHCKLGTVARMTEMIAPELQRPGSGCASGHPGWGTKRTWGRSCACQVLKFTRAKRKWEGTNDSQFLDRPKDFLMKCWRLFAVPTSIITAKVMSEYTHPTWFPTGIHTWWSHVCFRSHLQENRERQSALGCRKHLKRRGLRFRQLMTKKASKRQLSPRISTPRMSFETVSKDTIPRSFLTDTRFSQCADPLCLQLGHTEANERRVQILQQSKSKTMTWRNSPFQAASQPMRPTSQSHVKAEQLLVDDGLPTPQPTDTRLRSGVWQLDVSVAHLEQERISKVVVLQRSHHGRRVVYVGVLRRQRHSCRRDARQILAWKTMVEVSSVVLRARSFAQVWDSSCPETSASTYWGLGSLRQKALPYARTKSLSRSFSWRFDFLPVKTAASTDDTVHVQGGGDGGTTNQMQHSLQQSSLLLIMTLVMWRSVPKSTAHQTLVSRCVLEQLSRNVPKQAEYLLFCVCARARARARVCVCVTAHTQNRARVWLLFWWPYRSSSDQELECLFCPAIFVSSPKPKPQLQVSVSNSRHTSTSCVGVMSRIETSGTILKRKEITLWDMNTFHPPSFESKASQEACLIWDKLQWIAARFVCHHKWQGFLVFVTVGLRTNELASAWHTRHREEEGET